MTSQLIEENKIPEFGVCHLPFSAAAPILTRHSQIIYTLTLMGSFIIVRSFRYIATLILQPNRLASQ